MKTPEEIIEEEIAPCEIYGIDPGHDGAMVVAALNAAGYVIVPKEPTGAQRQLFREMVESGDDFTEIYPAILNEWVS